MRSRHRSVLICWLSLAVLLVLASCRDQEDRAPSADSAPGSPAGDVSSSPSADHPPTGAPPAAVQAAVDEVVYQVTGGFAGFQLELRIRKGGEAKVYDAGELVRQGELSADEWAELERLIEDAHLSELAGEHGRDDGSVADAMREVVSVRSRGETVTVATAGGPGGPLSGAFVDLTRRLMELALTLPASSSGGQAGEDRR